MKMKELIEKNKIKNRITFEEFIKKIIFKLEKDIQKSKEMKEIYEIIDINESIAIKFEIDFKSYIIKNNKTK